VSGILFCYVALTWAQLAAASGQLDTSDETLIRMTVQPMRAPQPALRYLLLPELKELTPGNPIPNYLKCILEQDFSTSDEVLGRAALRHADEAARMDKPDWQILLRVRIDGIGLLLPDVQKMRQLAAALQERFHNEASLRHFDDCLVTAKTMFAMARHMSEQPTLISDLVGMAIANLALAPLEEMLQQPGCPNLYWALTNLPTPLVSLDKGMEGERMLIDTELRDLDVNEPMTPEQLKKLMLHIDKIRDLEPREDLKRTQEWIRDRVKEAGRLEAARRRLVEGGFSEERLRRFPPEQVILLDEKRDYEIRRDEMMKTNNVPIWQAEALAAGVKSEKGIGIFEIFVPALIKVRRAQTRLDQRVALLRHIEALRMYAAEHAGNLPANLDQISVPLPVDPFSGKPFLYKREGKTVHLRGGPPKGMEKVSVFNVHYEITFQN
jgi:hypothetical protein